MILDFTKLFPKSCEQQGITMLCVDIDEIKYFKRTVSEKIGFKKESIIEDVLQVGGSTLRFQEDDDGIVILSSIIASKNIVEEFERMKSILTGNDLELLTLENKMSNEFLAECALKYCVKPS